MTIEAFIVNVNGVLSGKRVPDREAEKIFKEGLRLPYSVFAADHRGQDVLAAGLVTETGDGDGVAVPVRQAGDQVLLTMPGFYADPREVLKSVIALYTKRGWTPVVAAELEFYLVDPKADEHGRPQPPLLPKSGKRAFAAKLLSMGEMNDFGTFLDEVAATCKAQDIPAGAALSENGAGQFEINLHHVDDALRAADDAIMLKRAIKSVAEKNGMAATFMAKPYAKDSGNGLHIHFSVLDKKGNNIFDKTLKHAVAGVLANMTDFMAIAAPNANSYRRLRVGSHAPTTITWGYDNRSASVRIPTGATRIEYRVSGADANPYLVIAALLAAAYDGLIKKKAPPAPIKGNAYAAKAKNLPLSWDASLEAFAQSKFIAKYFGKKYQHLFLACKRQEQEGILSEISSVEHEAYLRDI